MPVPRAPPHDVCRFLAAGLLAPAKHCRTAALSAALRGCSKQSRRRTRLAHPAPGRAARGMSDHERRVVLSGARRGLATGRTRRIPQTNVLPRARACRTTCCWTATLLP